MCTKLGWKGKGTGWDILPLVLSANGHDPDYFDIPPELVMEVPLVHPTWVLLSHNPSLSSSLQEILIQLIWVTEFKVFNETIGKIVGKTKVE